MSHRAPWKPRVSNSRPPQKKPDALHGILGPGEPGDPAEQLAGATFRRRLDRGFRGRLGDIFRHARDPLRGDDPRDRKGCAPGGIERREEQQAGDLQGQAGHQHARDAEARGEPAAAEIGEDAGGLVEQKQERQHERRVAEAVEMQQHQHPQRAVRQGEAPVARGHNRIIAHRLTSDSSSRMTRLARSTMRQA